MSAISVIRIAPCILRADALVAGRAVVGAPEKDSGYQAGMKMLPDMLEKYA